MTGQQLSEHGMTPNARTLIQWWKVDHFKSDRDYHIYCDDCYHKIPDFLVRASYMMGFAVARDEYGLLIKCEGCNREAPPRTSYTEASNR